MLSWIDWSVGLAIAGLIAGCGYSETDLDEDGFTVAQGDCDDWDPGLHPEATDVLDDGIDQDCDGPDSVFKVEGLVHSCELRSDGSVACTGDNSFGQLEIPAEYQVFVQVVAGAYHTCARTPDSEVACWGDDTWGQTDVPPGKFSEIGAGSDFSWGRASITGWNVCWGRCRGDEAPI